MQVSLEMSTPTTYISTIDCKSCFSSKYDLSKSKKSSLPDPNKTPISMDYQIYYPFKKYKLAGYYI